MNASPALSVLLLSIALFRTDPVHAEEPLAKLKAADGQSTRLLIIGRSDFGSGGTLGKAI